MQSKKCGCRSKFSLIGFKKMFDSNVRKIPPESFITSNELLESASVHPPDSQKLLEVKLIVFLRGNFCLRILYYSSNAGTRMSSQTSRKCTQSNDFMRRSKQRIKYNNIIYNNVI